MSHPFYSIIIPTFNAEKTLKECLESVLNQSFLNYEVLVVDGVSDDNTISIVKHYAASFHSIRWVSEKDKGIYDAMNKGVGLAKGKWVYFMGSDDKLHSENVLKQVFAYDRKSAHVVYGNVRVIGNTTWARDGEIYDGEFDLKKLLCKNICHQAIFYKLNYLSSLDLFNINYKQCADYDLNLRCWSDKPFQYMNICIADFYGGGVTTSISGDDKFYTDLPNNLITYFGLKTLQRIKTPVELLNYGISAKTIKDSKLNTKLFPKIRKNLFLFIKKKFIY